MREPQSYSTVGTHLLEDDPSVELSAPHQLIDEIAEVHQVRIMINVSGNEDRAVDTYE